MQGLGNDPLAVLRAAAASLRSLKVSGEFGDGSAAAAAIRRLSALTHLSLALESVFSHPLDGLATGHPVLIDRLATTLFSLPLDVIASAAQPARVR